MRLLLLFIMSLAGCSAPVTTHPMPTDKVRVMGADLENQEDDAMQKKD